MCYPANDEVLTREICHLDRKRAKELSKKLNLFPKLAFVKGD